MAEKNKKDQTGEQEQDLSQILQVRRDKLAALQAAGKDPFQQTKFTVSAHAQEIKDHFEEMEGQPVTIAGRLMSKRGMGKVSFCDLQDKSGRIQLYARKDEMDEADYNEFKKYDIGDLVGVEGEVFRTQRGEMSVRCKQVTLLSKSLRPLPEKFHGLQDKELRYRQRYVDLIVNPESRRNFEIRSQLVSLSLIHILMPVEDVFTITGRGTVATGRVERGQIKMGDPVEIVGLADEIKKSVITGIEMFRKLLDYAEAGDNVGTLLRGIDKKEIERGQVLAKPGSIHPHTKFSGQVYVLSKDEGGRHTPFFNNYRPQFYFRTTDVTGVISLPEGVEMCMPGDNVVMNVELITPIAIEKGLRFAIREGGRTVGSGVVTEVAE